MANRLKTLFFILILSASVFSGTPLQSGEMSMKKDVCPMKCCKKSAKPRKTQSEENAKSLCRLLVCSTQNAPTGTNTNSQTNFASVIVASEKSTLFEILFSTTPKEDAKTDRRYSGQPKIFTPKYLQHQSFLI